MDKNQKKSNIKNLIDPDAVLHKLSAELFDLDDVSHTVLTICGSEGSQSEYNLQKRISKVSRYSIRRRINNPNGLLDLEFLKEYPGKRLRTGKQERLFDLTFKGFIASLSKLDFEKNQAIKFYKQNLQSHVDSKFADLILLYMRFNLTIILQWHLLNGLKLTHQKNTIEYFEQFNHLELFDQFLFDLEHMKDQKSVNDFNTIRFNFLVLQIVIAKILQSIEKKYSLQNRHYAYFNKMVNHYKSKTPLHDMIKDWIHFLDSFYFIQPSTQLRFSQTLRRYKYDVKVDDANDLSNLLLNKFSKFQKMDKRKISMI